MDGGGGRDGRGPGRAWSEFVPHTPQDVEAMLRAIGLRSLDELFSDIPREILERYQPLGLHPLSELETKRLLARIAEQNLDPRGYVSFLGAGVYDHDIPSVVSYFTQRSEFFTSYTPYQAEASQGTLTWMFEFQTMVCELTGMDVANASMYDGGSALAEAMLMAHHVTGRPKFLVARSVHPHYRQVVKTYAWAADLELVEVPYDGNGQLDKRFVEQHVRGRSGPTSSWAKDSRWGTRPTSGGRCWGCSPAAGRTCARCRGASPGAPRTSKDGSATS